MLLKKFGVQNYKSLRGVRVEPPALSVIVGANASGKSNFADSLDFVSEVYRHGLEVAIARKGGYENIAFRRMRRSKGAIAIDLMIEVSGSEASRGFPADLQIPSLRYQHSFSFQAKGYSIRADFQVVSECLRIFGLGKHGWLPMVDVTRDQDNAIRLARPPANGAAFAHDARSQRYFDRILDFSDLKYLAEKRQTLSSTELFTTSVGRYTFGLHAFIAAASGIRVFQLNSASARAFGVPTPRPEMEASGSNLPAVVDLLQRTSPADWQLVMEAMRSILPGLTAISVDYTSNRTLGLFFEEEGVGRAWSVDEVSDGTIQTLALLVSIFDSRYSALLLEEPENSVHPWIIRNVMDACKQASRSKQIVVTTHSPIVMNSVAPDQLYVMWRDRGESHLQPLTYLDNSFLGLWTEGRVPTFDYIDSGALPIALPPAPLETDE